MRVNTQRNKAENVRMQVQGILNTSTYDGKTPILALVSSAQHMHCMLQRRTASSCMYPQPRANKKHPYCE